MWYAYTVDYCSVIRKNTLLPYAATQTDWDEAMLSEISQHGKTNNDTYKNLEKYNKLVNTREKKQTHRYREQTMVTSVRARWGWGTARHKLM